MRAVLAPYMNYGLRDAEGKPITRKKQPQGHASQPGAQPVSVVLDGPTSIAPAFRILHFSETATDTHTITWAGTVGGVYRIEASPDLSTWTPLPGEMLAANEITSYDIDTSTYGTEHFFRVRQTF